VRLGFPALAMLIALATVGCLNLRSPVITAHGISPYQGEIAGMIVDMHSRMPLKGVLLELAYDGGGGKRGIRRQTTNERGEFKFGLIPRGKYLLGHSKVPVSIPDGFAGGLRIQAEGQLEQHVIEQVQVRIYRVPGSGDQFEICVKHNSWGFADPMVVKPEAPPAGSYRYTQKEIDRLPIH